MNTLKSVHSTVTIPQFVHNNMPHISRRWLLTACALFPILFITLLVLRQSDPITDLEAARARWAATGITDYRIKVEFQRPYSTCQQDFTVRGASIAYKYKDSCRSVGVITGNRATLWPTVENLFGRIEDAQKNAQCGPNGCVCDGPIEVTAIYHPDKGYPQQITYTLRQDLRTRDLQYWIAMLDGTLGNCPQVTYIGQTINVVSLEPLDPLVEQLSEPTPEVGVGSPFKPELTPDKTPEVSIGEAIKPEATP